MSLAATPSEIEVLADIARERSAGLDPFGDDEFDPPVPGSKELLDEAVGQETATEAAVAQASADPGTPEAVNKDKVSVESEGTDAADGLDATDDEAQERVKEAAAQAQDESEAAASEVKAEPVTEVSKATVKEVKDPPVPTYQTELPADYQAQRSALMKEKSLAMKKLIDGDLELEAFAEIESRVSKALEDLTAQRIRSETLNEANVQNQQAMQQSEIRRLIARAKSEVDYLSDTKAQKSFDVALRTLQADPDNAAAEFGELVGEAHRVVMALRNGLGKAESVIPAASAAPAVAPVVVPATVKEVKVVKATPVAAAAAAPDRVLDRQPVEKPPVTLRGLPVASTPNSNGDVIEQMSRLSGQAYQDAFAKLSPQQRRSLIDEE